MFKTLFFFKFSAYTKRSITDKKEKNTFVFVKPAFIDTLLNAYKSKIYVLRLTAISYYRIVLHLSGIS